MTALHGLHHVGILTDDLDRFLAFYQTTFGARAVRDTTDDGVRNALIDVGGGFLHVFLVAGGNSPRPDLPRFQSGRLNHFALRVPTGNALLEIRRRLMSAGRSDGLVRDFGAVWSLKFRDPAGVDFEVIWTVNQSERLSSPPRILAEQDALTAAEPGAISFSPE
jgi:catechol 2,3-dioxygenase-like lactoylglutathione lyase family enzyme